MTEDKVVFTANKELIHDIIFKDHEREAIKMCKILAQYGIYEGFAGFGLYLNNARHTKGREKIEQEIAEKLQKILNGQKEETHRVWIILQAVMLWMAGGAPEEFKEAVNN